MINQRRGSTIRQILEIKDLSYLELEL